MLRELNIRQFALMDSVELSFAEGMTVFTGETGAGKSILVDALGAAFGVRASSDWVRHGAERAEVVATLDATDPRLKALLAEQDLEADGELILRRVISAEGGSKAWINGMPAPVKLLQQIGDICLDLHGQHEHQALLHAEFQAAVVDARIDAPLLEALRQAYRALRQAERQLASLSDNRRDTEQQEQWMREELKRLEALSPEEGLAESLAADVEAGRHVSQIQQAAARALDCLGDGEVNARALLAEAAHAVEGAADYHESLRQAAELIGQLDVLLGETEPHLRDALDAAFDPAELQMAEERLMNLREAMRRHDADEAGLLALMEDWRQRLSGLETAGWDEEKLRKALQAAETGYRQAAEALSGARRKQAGALVTALRPFLDRLGLKGMQVSIEVEPQEMREQWNESGWDTIRFMASSNPGEPFRELAAIASGGEISRFVLALKGCGALATAPEVAVFDEVDVGIGGETAWCVGELLAAMGRERQVLVVSHLPQVAACADHQVCIRKEQQEGRTVTRLERADHDGRLQELARMLGGTGRESVEHAGRMLERGRALAGG